MASIRVLIVSSRLPVSVQADQVGLRLAPASGGLAAGLRPWHEEGAGQWIGRPGDLSRLTPDQREDLGRQLRDCRIRLGVFPMGVECQQCSAHSDNGSAPNQASRTSRGRPLTISTLIPGAAETGQNTLIVANGDDRTDEDLTWRSKSARP